MTQSLNSTLSNDPWSKKRHTLQTHSLARLTTGSVLTFPTGVSGFTQDEWTSEWNEERIAGRGVALAKLALAAWPRPSRAEAIDTDAVVVEAMSASQEPMPPQTPGPVRTTTSYGTRTRSVHDVSGSILPLIQAALVFPGDLLRHDLVRTGRVVSATITGGGRIETPAGTFDAPSPALRALVGYEVNGWKSWVHAPTGKTLWELREML